MQKEPQSMLDERLYDELQTIGGLEDTSQSIESLILRQFCDAHFESAYQQMAEDEARETEALEWAEAMVRDPDAMR